VGRGLRRVGLAGILLGLSIVACGQADRDPQAEVREAYGTVVERFDAGDHDGVCKRLTAAARARATGSSDVRRCGARLGRILAEDRRTTSRVRPKRRALLAVRAADGRATATIAMSRRIPGTVPLVAEDGVWRLDSLTVRPSISKSRWAPATAQTKSFSDLREALGRLGLCVPLDEDGLAGQGTGGCLIDLASPSVPVIVLTAVGDFELARCRASFRLYFDSVNIIGYDAAFSGNGFCDRVRTCRREGRSDDHWSGSRIPSATGSVALRLGICVGTPAGRAEGEQTIELARRRDRWWGHPADYPVGESSIQLGGRWTVRPAGSAARLPG